ncbi:MAG: hypothetical protein CMJ80_01955 [Planctomycetaceae bacterium]|nr:hypothetical protein [Planctomycetaceae bacterium]
MTTELPQFVKSACGPSISRLMDRIRTRRSNQFVALSTTHTMNDKSLETKFTGQLLSVYWTESALSELYCACQKPTSKP